MRQQGWRHLLSLKHLLLQASSNASCMPEQMSVLNTEAAVAPTKSWRSLLQELQSAEEALPLCRSFGLVAPRHFGSARPNSSGKAASKTNFEEPDEKLESDKKGRRVNRAVTDRFVRVVTEEGHQVMTRQAALEYAQQSGLDLVEVDSRANPIVCKLMDYKKEKYLEKRRDQERRKQQVDKRRLNDLKEVRFGTKIEQKDLEMKAENASRLLQRGHKVKLQGSVPEDGTVDPKFSELLHKMINLLQHISKVESEPRFASHRAWVMLKPSSPGVTVISSDPHTTPLSLVNSSQGSASDGGSVGC
ncbi:hypothetical protein O6H91_01G024900 [Diphasiastrum complanatum]|uniref:Uncharacterized protein n=1 Tax=Diphasiastrum complanatum TaxID=34168 RepID=A0ACC2EPC6_DIPCM|nr:hypothetical protein O6H91_01G024900 [Diphasiastrum complanatum]